MFGETTMVDEIYTHDPSASVRGSFLGTHTPHGPAAVCGLSHQQHAQDMAETLRAIHEI